MDCRWTQRNMAGYIDGQLGLAARSVVRWHLLSCAECYERYEDRESLSCLMSQLTVAPPADFRTRIHVALSQQSSMGFWERRKLHLGNLMRPIAVPAAGGIAMAVVLFFALMSNVGIMPRMFAEDVPLRFLARAWVSHPQMSVSTPFSVTEETVVLAFIDADGSVYDFRVIPGQPGASAKLESELANALLTTKFEPATSFGRPVMGAAVIGLRPATEVTVKG